MTTIARFWYCKNGTVLSDVETAPAKLDFVHLVVLQKRATRSQEEGRLTQFIFFYILSGRSAPVQIRSELIQKVSFPL